MSNMSGWFENETLATFSLGIVFGTIIWDLVFEIRPGLAPRDIDAARSYYRGLHTAQLPVNLVLPLAAIYILGFFGVRALAANDLPSWLWLGALVAVLAMEIINQVTPSTAQIQPRAQGYQPANSATTQNAGAQQRAQSNQQQRQQTPNQPAGSSTVPSLQQEAQNRQRGARETQRFQQSQSNRPGRRN